MIATTSPVARTAARSTSITGRTSRTCTGRNADGEVRTYRVGERAWVLTWIDNSDHGEGLVSSQSHGTIVRIGVGTEEGMLGTTAIVELALDHGALVLVPARLLGVTR